MQMTYNHVFKFLSHWRAKKCELKQCIQFDNQFGGKSNTLSLFCVVKGSGERSGKQSLSSTVVTGICFGSIFLGVDSESISEAGKLSTPFIPVIALLGVDPQDIIGEAQRKHVSRIFNSVCL